MRKFVFGFVVGILTLPAAFLLLAWLGLFPALANADPPEWEKVLAQMTLSAYVSRHAPHLTNPVKATDENLLAGMKIFKDACAGCHGDPTATSDYGASFYPHVQMAKAIALKTPAILSEIGISLTKTYTVVSVGQCSAITRAAES